MAKITYLDKDLYNKVKKDADKKFSKDSYVKNMWVLKEYERRGGKTKKSGEKPKNEKIKKQVTGSWELDFDLDTFEVAEYDDFDKAYQEYCKEFGLDDSEVIEADAKEDRIDEAYKKFKSVVNMSKSAIERWAESPCSKKASLSRAPIKRVIKLLETKKEDWTSASASQGLKVYGFVSRMKNAEQGKPMSEECKMSKRDASLMNWGHKP